MYVYLAVPAFRDVIDVPLVVRRLHRSRKEVLAHKTLLNSSLHYSINNAFFFFFSSNGFLVVGEEGAWNRE